MSEATRTFFSAKDNPVPENERRFVRPTVRLRSSAGSRNRPVEVVHVRRRGSQPVEAQSRQSSWSVRSETWPDGFKAKPAPPSLFSEQAELKPEQPQQVGHVVGVWQPSQHWIEHHDGAAAEASAAQASEPPERKRGRLPKAREVAAIPERTFVDPFADEDGANCMRCGYAVEPARERRGLLTCAACG